MAVEQITTGTGKKLPVYGERDPLPKGFKRGNTPPGNRKGKGRGKRKGKGLIAAQNPSLVAKPKVVLLYVIC